MRIPTLRILSVAVLASVYLHAAAAELRAWSFDADPVDKPPAGFSLGAGEWVVVADDAAPSPKQVLEQRAKSANSTYNLALVDGATWGDVALSVRLKAVSGETDQGGGVVWRAADAKNYYVARWNPLENNLRAYKVVDGKRTQLASADTDLEGGWHTLTVTMRGDEMVVSLDGAEALRLKDATFAQPGQVGVWCKADARTQFDDLTADAPATETAK